MDYERAYKEMKARVLEIGRGYVKGVDFSKPRQIAEYIDTDLKESEDERIRKELIEQVAYIVPNDDEVDSEGNVLPTYQKRIDKYRAWLEKQGEQKPTDKAELKFKVGDWIVYNRNDSSREILYVYDIRDSRYYFNDNIHFSWSVKECDEKCRLWTIQDANDGDVLATKKGNPFIYDKNRYNNGLAYYYAGLDVNKELTLKSPHHMLAHFGELSSVFPATKEQCDLLFQKMKEAGYEWDAEKKELKKVENNSNMTEELTQVQQEYVDANVHALLKKGLIPTLKGKEKADFENEFNKIKQTVGMINWPSSIEVFKNVILYFIAWSQTHIGNLFHMSEEEKAKMDDKYIPSLDDAAEEYTRTASHADIGLRPIPFNADIKDLYNRVDIKRAFKAGALWMLGPLKQE